MPVSSSPICSRERGSKVWQLEVNGSQFNWLRVSRTPRNWYRFSAGILIPGESIETIGDNHPEKTLWLYRTVTNEAEQE